MSLPTVPRDLVPVAASHYTSLTYDLPAGSTYNGVPVTGVLWAVSTYHDGATCSLHGPTGIVIPDSIPDWVPRPPAAWLALAADMAAEVGLAPEPLPVVAVPLNPSPESQTGPLLNPLPEAIRRLGFGRSKVYEEIAAGNLRVVKVGRRTLIAEAELQRYVQRLVEAGAA